MCIGIFIELLEDRWSYCEMDRAIGRCVSFSFFCTYMKLYFISLDLYGDGLSYWDIDGAIEIWMELFLKLYKATLYWSIFESSY